MRRFDGWGKKLRARRGEGTGRMRYKKNILRMVWTKAPIYSYTIPKVTKIPRYDMKCSGKTICYLYCIWKISCSISFTDVFPLHFVLLQGILYYLGQCILYYLWPREILPERNSNYSWTSARASCTIRKTGSWISLRASFKLLTFLLKIIKRDGHNLQLHLQVNFIRIYRIKRNFFF